MGVRDNTGNVIAIVLRIMEIEGILYIVTRCHSEGSCPSTLPVTATVAVGDASNQVTVIRYSSPLAARMFA